MYTIICCIVFVLAVVLLGATIISCGTDLVIRNEVFLIYNVLTSIDAQSDGSELYIQLRNLLQSDGLDGFSFVGASNSETILSVLETPLLTIKSSELIWIDRFATQFCSKIVANGQDHKAYRVIGHGKTL